MLDRGFRATLSSALFIATALAASGCSDDEPTGPGNDRPVVEITAPADGSDFVQGELVEFTGTGVDEEDGVLIGPALMWRSSISGQLGVSSGFATSQLPAGIHVVSLIGTDSGGRADTAQITITIAASGAPRRAARAW